MIHLPKELSQLFDALIAHGARPVVVGGFVRDALLNTPSKDIDIEVYALQTLDELKSLLSPYGNVHEVGKSFGVLKLRIKGYECDFSFPRTESKTGSGHRGFDVICDGALDFSTAARRRDFTINSMGYDVKTKELLDPYGGTKDLKKKILRCVDTHTFVEDPLRVWRAVQFATRFELECDEELIVLCRKMKQEGSLDELPKERLFEELKKLLLKASRPSMGFKLMQQMGLLETFPELAAMQGVEQDPAYHPEGDVWTHTLLCLDAMAQESFQDEKERLIMMLAILCHDMGKPATTAFNDGRIRAIGHEIEGLKPTRRFIERLSDEQQLMDEILPLVEHHLKPLQFFKQGAKSAAIRRLCVKVNIEKLVKLARADFFGRTTEEALSRRFEAGEWLLREAEALNVHLKAPVPLIQGRNLIHCGLTPSPEFKPILDAAFDAQLEGEFSDADQAAQWLENYLKES